LTGFFYFDEGIEPREFEGRISSCFGGVHEGAGLLT